jgi:hypothetical protein
LKVKRRAYLNVISKAPKMVKHLNSQVPPFEGFLPALWAIGMSVMSVAALNTSFKEEPEDE